MFIHLNQLQTKRITIKRVKLNNVKQTYQTQIENRNETPKKTIETLKKRKQI